MNDIKAVRYHKYKINLEVIILIFLRKLKFIEYYIIFARLF